MKQKNTESLTIRLTFDEKCDLNVMAKRVGMSRAEVIKFALFWYERSDLFKGHARAFSDFLEEQFDTPLTHTTGDLSNGTTQHQRN